jgi:hypothetical protein
MRLAMVSKATVALSAHGRGASVLCGLLRVAEGATT